MADSYNKILEGRKGVVKSHADRWQKVGTLLANRRDAPVLKWIKAHVTEELQLKLKLDSRVLAGNECADAMAGRGAKLADIDLDDKRKIKWAERRGWAIRNRLAHIQLHILDTQGEEQDGEGEDARKAKRESKDKGKKRKAEEREREKEEAGEAEEAPKGSAEGRDAGGELSAKKQKFNVRELLCSWLAKRSLNAQEGEAPAERPTKIRVRKKTSEATLRQEIKRADRKRSLGQIWKESIDRRVEEMRGRAHSSHHIEGNEHLVWCERCGGIADLAQEGHLRKLSEKCAKPTLAGKSHLKMIGCGKNPLDAKAKAGK